MSRNRNEDCSDGNLVPICRDQSLLGTFWKKWSLFGPYFLTLVPISKNLTPFFSFLYDRYNSMIFTALTFGSYFLRLVLISTMVPIFWIFWKNGPYLVLVLQNPGPYLVLIRDFSIRTKVSITIVHVVK